MPYCTNCGHEHADGDEFCANCGRSLTAHQVSSSTARPWYRRKRFAIPLGVLGFIVLIGVVAQDESGTRSQPPPVATAGTTSESAKTTSGSGSNVTVAPAVTVAPNEAVHEFSGTGDDVAQLSLGNGLVLVDATHAGRRNFIIRLRGSSDELLVNDIGVYKGTSVLGAAGGHFLLEVEADGAWTIRVREPRNQLASGSRSFQGQGDAASGFIRLNGVHTVTATHNGKRNFVIWLYKDNGNREDLVVNDIGPYSGRKSVRVSSGLYMLAVEADGAWTIEVQ